VLDDPFGGTADKDISKSAVAVSAYDDKITILFPGGFNNSFGGGSVFD
jgi:hypothetical protein